MANASQGSLNGWSYFKENFHRKGFNLGSEAGLYARFLQALLLSAFACPVLMDFYQRLFGAKFSLEPMKFILENTPTLTFVLCLVLGGLLLSLGLSFMGFSLQLKELAKANQELRTWVFLRDAKYNIRADFNGIGYGFCVAVAALALIFKQSWWFIPYLWAVCGALGVKRNAKIKAWTGDNLPEPSWLDAVRFLWNGFCLIAVTSIFLSIYGSLALFIYLNFSLVLMVIAGIFISETIFAGHALGVFQLVFLIGPMFILLNVAMTELPKNTDSKYPPKVG